MFLHMTSRAAKAPVFSLNVESRAPLSVVVSRKLRKAIVSGEVQDGTALPSEKELTEQLGVGRSTVREALRILQAQGLLSGGDTVSTQRPRVSSEQSMVTARDVIENVLRLGRVPLADLVALRLLIEGETVTSAALKKTRDVSALAKAREAVAVMSAPNVPIKDFRAADLAFHQALARAAGNVAFELVMSVLRDAISAYLGERLETVPSSKAAMAKLAKEHAAILDAIEKRKPKLARSRINAHIRGFYEGET
jgi:DNA-binding FadR family transcriptional regulator